MNSLTAEKLYQLAKWSEIIKSCKSSGIQVSEQLKQNNISKNQYYYWQLKLKDACLESLHAKHSTFVELPVEVPQVCETKPVVKKATYIVWTSDFTYIKIGSKWYYLCIVIDLFSRKVISWHISEKPDVDLAMTAF